MGDDILDAFPRFEAFAAGRGEQRRLTALGWLQECSRRSVDLCHDLLRVGHENTSGPGRLFATSRLLREGIGGLPKHPNRLLALRVGSGLCPLLLDERHTRADRAEFGLDGCQGPH